MGKFKQKGFNPGQGTGLGAGFDPSGVAEELRTNPNAMIAEDLTRVTHGQFGRDANLKDKRDLYQTRAKGNLSSKMKSIRENTEFYEYIDPRTGEKKEGINEKYTKPVEQNIQDVTVGGSSSKGVERFDNTNAQGQGVDWQKVDTGRRQRTANTAKYGTTNRQARKFQRQQNRATNRMQRQQRRDARKLQRQTKRINEG